jgi:hypothetical protein
MKKKELIKALAKEQKKNKKKASKKVVDDWCCVECGVTHEAGSCMAYQKAKNQYWAIRRYYSSSR